MERLLKWIIEIFLKVFCTVIVFPILGGGLMLLSFIFWDSRFHKMGDEIILYMWDETFNKK